MKEHEYCEWCGDCIVCDLDGPCWVSPYGFHIPREDTTEGQKATPDD